MSFISKDWSSKLKTKINKTVVSTYNVDDYQINPVSINDVSEQVTKSTLTDHLYRIDSNAASVGYIYVSQAPSMKNVFDYIVLFDVNLKVLNTKVLIYREKHGKQIGTKRWLSQFFNLTTADRPTLGDNIDGISGATISATSMTTAVGDLLESLDYMKTQGQL